MVKLVNSPTITLILPSFRTFAYRSGTNDPESPALMSCIVSVKLPTCDFEGGDSGGSRADSPIRYRYWDFRNDGVFYIFYLKWELLTARLLESFWHSWLVG